MINKFPKKAYKKWNRFDKFEKGFIVYCILLPIIILSLPIIQIENQNFYTVNSYNITTSAIIIFLIAFLILRNTSFRFKKIINIIIWFRENDALLNFWILTIIAISYLSIADTIHIINQTFTTQIQLITGYYIILTIIIIGLVWNLFLALNFTKDRKKNKIVNVIQKWGDEDKNPKEDLKWLFEEK